MKMMAWLSYIFGLKFLRKLSYTINATKRVVSWNENETFYDP